MKKENGIKWLFLDLNSYFASVEQQENPKLRGKPVAIVPIQTEHTCVIAASYEAKAYGVKTGTKVRDALLMCPNLICVPAHHDKYVEYHNRIISEIILHTPINQICSIDELSSRLPPAKRTIYAALKIAQNIKDGLRKNIGESITCSIGLAPNVLLAKIAADMKKPDGITILQQEDLPKPLLHLQLIDLPGIGHHMKKRLKSAGIKQVADFWNITPKHARHIWKSVEGERFWYLLHGYDFEKPETKNVMIGHSRVLDPNLRSPESTRQIARLLITKAAHRLRYKNYFTSKIFVSLHTTTNFRLTKEISIIPAQDTVSLLQNLDMLWKEMLREFFTSSQSKIPLDSHTELNFKKVSIILSGLLQKHEITDDLLVSGNATNLCKLHKNESLTSAIDKLRHKYSQDVVSFGFTPQTLSGFVGTKIAFTRVPDIKEFQK